MTDMVHSLRRIIGAFHDYLLVSGDELVSSHLIMAVRSFAPEELRQLFVTEFTASCLRAKNRLSSASVVEIARLRGQMLIALCARRGIVTTLVPETFLVWKKRLNHGLLRCPISVACARLSPLVYVGTEHGSILSINNHVPASVHLVAGHPTLPTLPEAAVPKPKGRSPARVSLSDARFVKPTGLALFDNDRYLVVADHGRPGQLCVVEYPTRWSAALPASSVFCVLAPLALADASFSDVAVVGGPVESVQTIVLASDYLSGSLIVASLSLPLHPRHSVDVLRSVSLSGVPCQMAVRSGSPRRAPVFDNAMPRSRTGWLTTPAKHTCYLTLWSRTDDERLAVASVELFDNFQVGDIGAPFRDGAMPWGITVARAVLPAENSDANPEGNADGEAHTSDLAIERRARRLQRAEMLAMASEDRGTLGVVVGTLRDAQLFFCHKHMSLVLAGICGTVGDADGPLPGAHFNQPAALATSPFAPSSVYCVTMGGQARGTLRLVNLASAGLLKFLLAAHDMGEALGLQDGAGYVRRHLGQLGEDSVEGYQARIRTALFRPVVWRAVRAISIVLDDTNLMGRALGRIGHSNPFLLPEVFSVPGNAYRRIETKGPHGTPNSATTRRFFRHLLGMQDEFNEVCNVGLTGLSPTELDSRFQLGADLTTTKAERSNAAQRQYQSNISGAELGTVAEVCAFEPGAVEDQIVDSVETPFPARTRAHASDWRVQRMGLMRVRVSCEISL